MCLGSRFLFLLWANEFGCSLATFLLIRDINIAYSCFNSCFFLTKNRIKDITTVWCINTECTGSLCEFTKSNFIRKNLAKFDK
jgi:hypothetical protein